VLRKVVEKYALCSFSEYQIAFNPKDEIEVCVEKNPRWSFPTGVYDEIHGIDVVFEG
jgi:hypothetical protein